MDSVGEGGKGIWTHTEKNTKHIGFLSNTGPDSLKMIKATKPAFNVGSSLAHRRFSGGAMMTCL